MLLQPGGTVWIDCSSLAATRKLVHDLLGDRHTRGKCGHTSDSAYQDSLSLLKFNESKAHICRLSDDARPLLEVLLGDSRAQVTCKPACVAQESARSSISIKMAILTGE